MAHGPKVAPSGSVLNALAILECFDRRHPSLALAEISRRLDIPKATAYRNLAALEQFGYVTWDRQRNTYSLGAKVLELSRRFLDQYEILTVARPVLADLAAETGETAHIGVLNGTDVVYVDIAESPQRVRAYVTRGDRLPAHCVASGKAILAYADEATVEAVLDAGLKKMTAKTLVSREDVLEDLARTRKRGYGLNLGEWMDEVAAASAPVFSHTGDVIGAIGVAGPLSRLSPRKADAVGRAARKHADRVSTVLGAPIPLKDAI
ncbi:IclR family transcriptional regulator [Rhodospirillaceae bacterium SYSU D60014]|uniref:IclR family transcriptional regulator n=1 Tax=Virgifigura deserti TaxID=2268457 RepID=UPI0013C52BF3